MNARPKSTLVNSHGRVAIPAATLLIGIVAGFTTGCGREHSSPSTGESRGSTVSKQFELLNVSYDPTRELWRDLNEQFIADYKQKTGADVTIKQSHGGSSSQARAVIDGLDADVVTLGMWSDIAAVERAGLIEADWQSRLPHDSLPYFSTIVFVVRKGNPKGIKDWPDLVKEGVSIVTPNPKTSGNGKLSFLAAWGSVTTRGGSEQQAQEFVTQLYRHAPVLDSGARAATTTFSQKGIGDVHLAWENEARFELEESKGALEVVYPPISIRAEPYIAVVDANVTRKGTAAVAEAYLNFVYTKAGQQTAARHAYRPVDEEVLQQFAESLPPLKLFTIREIASGWDEAQERFFAADAIFDQIYQPQAE
jgi:sulfate transport system substrate-binding protein